MSDKFIQYEMLKAEGYKKGSIVSDVISLKKFFGKKAGKHDRFRLIIHHIWKSMA